MNNDLKVLRKKIILSALAGGGGHIASSFSSLEIIWALYEGKVMSVNPCNPQWENRDRFILSKGHAALALYVCLADMGFFDDSLLETFTRPNSILGGEPLNDIPGVETPTGSLGHGLSYGIGLSLGFKHKGENNKVFVLIGDGECQEGSIWEAAGLGSALQLNNLTVILDSNEIQKMDYVKNIYGNVDWKTRWESFGWIATEVDGHNVDELVSELSKENVSDKPKIVIAHTTKGKGSSIMENVVNWHYKLPSKKEWKIIRQELDISQEEIDYAKGLH